MAQAFVASPASSPSSKTTTTTTLKTSDTAMTKPQSSLSAAAATATESHDAKPFSASSSSSSSEGRTLASKSAANASINAASASVSNDAGTAPFTEEAAIIPSIEVTHSDYERSITSEADSEHQNDVQIEVMALEADAPVPPLAEEAHLPVAAAPVAAPEETDSASKKSNAGGITVNNTNPDPIVIGNDDNKATPKKKVHHQQQQQQSQRKKRGSINATPKKLGIRLSNIFSSKSSSSHSSSGGGKGGASQNKAPFSSSSASVVPPPPPSPPPPPPETSRVSSNVKGRSIVTKNGAENEDHDDGVSTSAQDDLDNDGQQSVAAETVHSIETIKASNRQYLVVSQDQRSAHRVSLLKNMKHPEPALPMNDTAMTKGGIDKLPPPTTTTKSGKKGWQRKLRQLVSRGTSSNNYNNSSSSTGNNNKGASSAAASTVLSSAKQRSQQKGHSKNGNSSASSFGGSAHNRSSSHPNIPEDPTSALSRHSAYPLRARVLSEDNAQRWMHAGNVRSSSGGIPSTPQPSSSLRSPTSITTGRSQSFGQKVDYFTKLQQEQLDLAIRGRLDGVDVLSLGSTRRTTFPPRMAEPKSRMTQYIRLESDDSTANTNSKVLDPLDLSFTGVPTSLSSTDIVNDMIWTSAGKEQPELIFEGYIPGGGDRWIVRLEPSAEEEEVGPISSSSKTENQDEEPFDVAAMNQSLDAAIEKDASTPIPATFESGGITPTVLPQQQPIATEDNFRHSNGGDDNDDEKFEDSSNVPLHTLWNQMWGTERPPPRPGYLASDKKQSKAGENDADGNDVGTTDRNASDEADGNDADDILALAASCNVPIDIDEDTFIIDGPAHLRSVHDLVTAPIQQRKFDTALEIFDKLLKGLMIPNNSKLNHVVGATHHNIGIIQCCQGDYASALRSFQDAVMVRTKCLPINHPDTAVSYMRKGMAEFALQKFEASLASFHRALESAPTNNATRAKILTNIGVTHFCKNNLAEALKVFTFALEIQRQWLDGQIRRESIVFDSSVTLGNMGIVYLARADYDLAFYVYEEACLLLTSSFRKDHDIVLSSLAHLAISKAKNEDYAKSIKLFQGILRSQQSRFGTNGPQVIETTGIIGYLYIKSVDFHAALKFLHQVRNWQTKNLDADHTSRKMTDDTIQAIEKCLQGSASVWV